MSDTGCDHPLSDFSGTPCRMSSDIRKKKGTAVCKPSVVWISGKQNYNQMQKNNSEYTMYWGIHVSECQHCNSITGIFDIVSATTSNKNVPTVMQNSSYCCDVFLRHCSFLFFFFFQFRHTNTICVIQQGEF